MGRGKEAHRDFLLSIIDDPQAFLEVTDLVGLDVRLAIAEYLHRALGGGGALRAADNPCATRWPVGSWGRRRERGSTTGGRLETMQPRIVRGWSALGLQGRRIN